MYDAGCPKNSASLRPEWSQVAEFFGPWTRIDLVDKKLLRGGNPLNIIQHTGAPSYPDSVQAVRWRKDGTSRKPQDAVER